MRTGVATLAEQTSRATPGTSNRVATGAGGDHIHSDVLTQGGRLQISPCDLGILRTRQIIRLEKLSTVKLRNTQCSLCYFWGGSFFGYE